MSALPFVDEHEITIDAPLDHAWSALLDLVDAGFAGAAAGIYARLVGCDDTEAAGPRPLAVGSTIPGFHVVEAAPEHALALQGRHRFSRYALTFRLEADGPERSIARAETRAAFPGLLGQAYRVAVIGTGGHAFAMRRLLTSLRRRVAVPAGP